MSRVHRAGSSLVSLATTYVWRSFTPEARIGGEYGHTYNADRGYFEIRHYPQADEALYVVFTITDFLSSDCLEQCRRREIDATMKQEYVIQIDNNSNAPARYSIYARPPSIEGVQDSEIYSTIFSQTSETMHDTTVKMVIPGKCFAICGNTRDQHFTSTTSIDIPHSAHLPTKAGSTSVLVSLDDRDRAIFVNSSESTSDAFDGFTIRTDKFTNNADGKILSYTTLNHHNIRRNACSVPVCVLRRVSRADVPFAPFSQRLLRHWS